MSNRYLIPIRTIWIVLLGIVFWQACLPNPPSHYTLINDKLAHFLVFLIIGLSAWAIWPKSRVPTLILPLLAVYGGTIEIVQHFVPNRFLSVLDWISDIGGLVTSWLLMRVKLILQNAS